MNEITQRRKMAQSQLHRSVSRPLSVSSWVRKLIGVGICLAIPWQAVTAAYPDRPVKVIVPFAPGGFTDIAARVVAQQLGDILNGTFIVENKPGAGSTIGTDFVAKAPPDGYTLALISSNHVSSHLLYPSLTYDPITSFTPIALVADSPYVLFANASLPVKNVKELVDRSHSSPTVMHYGTSGNGSTQHLMGSMFLTKSGAKLAHIPYKGSGQAMQDLVAGFVEVSFAAISNGLPHLKADRLKALAVTGPVRSPYLPDVPTMQEAGIAGYEAVVWLALVGPANMPADLVAKLNEAVKKGLSTPSAQASLTAAGVDVKLSSPQELKKYMEDEVKVWEAVIKSTEFKLE
jgi:tripartite-type tricarboxylate transporter receptor subunit TctC